MQTPNAYECSGPVYKQIKEAFDTDYNGNWEEWRALDSFSQRMAKILLEDLEPYLRQSMRSGSFREKYQRKIIFRGMEANEVEPEAFPGLALRVRQIKGALLPLEERMFFRLCSAGQIQKYPRRGPQRERLISIISQKILQYFESEMKNLKAALKPIHLSFKLKPLYRGSQRANLALLLACTPTVCGPLLVQQTAPISQRRNGPTGFTVSWKVELPE